jgi:hypothetical protein
LLRRRNTKAVEGELVVGRRGAMVVLPVVAALALGFSAFGALGGFNAAISNPTNTFGSGSLVLAEYTGDAATSTPACVSNIQGDDSSTINQSPVGSNSNTGDPACDLDLFGGGDTGDQLAVPGTASVNDVTFANLGTVSASSFTVTANGSCLVSNNTSDGNTLWGTDTSGFCSVVDIAIAEWNPATNQWTDLVGCPVVSSNPGPLGNPNIGSDLADGPDGIDCWPWTNQQPNNYTLNGYYGGGGGIFDNNTSTITIPIATSGTTTGGSCSSTEFCQGNNPVTLRFITELEPGGGNQQDPGATNADQGLVATQPMTFTLN